MADNARGIHVSPGIYSREIDLDYAVKSLGITTLGLAGETLKGPAFEPISIEDWNQFQDRFGGTSTEKFQGSQYPKYELPYIAKSYLSESKQLEVCRVLGLSGFNAGPAWAITAQKGGEHMVIAVLRSRGYYNDYEKYAATSGNCICGLSAHDKLHYYVGEFSQVPECKYVTHYNPKALTINQYVDLNSNGDECMGYQLKNGGNAGFGVSTTNYGKFTLSGHTGAYDGTNYEGEEFRYSVSLNPADKNYILKVLGTNTSDSDAPIYVEALYDVALLQGIEANEIHTIDGSLVFYDVCFPVDMATVAEVSNFVVKPEGSLTRADLGKRFLYASNYNTLSSDDTTYHHYKMISGKSIQIVDSEFYCKPEDAGAWTEDDCKGGTSSAATNVFTYLHEPNKYAMQDGEIYTVRAFTDLNSKRHYYYTRITEGTYIKDEKETNVPTNVDTLDQTGVNWGYEKSSYMIDKDGWSTFTTPSNVTVNKTIIVKNSTDELYYTKPQNGLVKPVTCDLNNYKTNYKFASTPWIVSNLKGDYNNIDMNRLFRFHTISDGNNANYEVKISIINILPDEGSFTVQVRDINDSDVSPVVYEVYNKCTLVPGDKNYIAYKIGSYDGTYESKSKYITVEVNENLTTRNSIPAGFLGYPLAHYDGSMIVDNAKQIVKNDGNTTTTKSIEDGYVISNPYIKYNVSYDEDIKNRKQYFGLSDWMGVDVDMFTYKGNAAYLPENIAEYPKSLSNGFHLDSRADSNSYADGTVNITVDGQSGFTFEVVGPNNVTETLQSSPIIGTEDDMEGCIYEYVNLRKFTVYFYGGFDGWDEYRKSRTIGDKYMLSKYQGNYNNVTGEGFAFNKIKNPDLIGLNQKGITSDWYAYLAAIRQFANPEKVDINVFATPGIDYVNNKQLVEETIEMIEEERADSIYITTTPDKPFGAYDYVDEMYTPDEAVENLEGTEIDSNYTATYYPWVKYEDKTNNQYIYLPPTKDVVRNMAMTDNVAFPWFAPAGLERGAVDCVKAHTITKLADEDVLYEGRINPVKTFASDGVKIWGQKNLQIKESQLNRIAVRRLLLRMRKLIAISCLGLIFEPNDATTKDKFLSTVTPILDNIRANRGISDYKIKVNDSIESRERRELPAYIYFKPYNALEYIDLTFVLTPEGVSFDDI